MRLLRLTGFATFARNVGIAPKLQATATARLVRFCSSKSVWFADVTESPNQQRNGILRPVDADAVS